MSITAPTPTRVTITSRIDAPVDQVWTCFTAPAHITQWNAASDDWHCPRAENDLRVGGRFSSRMEARDGSLGFDFEGTYTEVVPNTRIAYAMADGRKVETDFAAEGGGTRLSTTFDAESENPVEMQRSGWQAILDKFKGYAEQQR